MKTEEEASIFGGEAGAWYDPCYHQLCDDVNNVDYTAWENNAKLVAHGVATYANSLEGFPERVPAGNGTVLRRSVLPDNVKPAKISSLKHKDALYHGPMLVM